MFLLLILVLQGGIYLGRRNKESEATKSKVNGTGNLRSNRKCTACILYLLLYAFATIKGNEQILYLLQRCR